MTDRAITDAISAYRKALAPLARAVWRPGRKDSCNLWADTDPDYLNHVSLGKFATPEIAARAYADHQAMLDLEWLTEAGFNVELIRVELFRRQGNRWRVSLQPAPDGWTAICGQGGSIGEALAKAREWAEGRQS